MSADTSITVNSVVYVKRTELLALQRERDEWRTVALKAVAIVERSRDEAISLRDILLARQGQGTSVPQEPDQ